MSSDAARGTNARDSCVSCLVRLLALGMTMCSFCFFSSRRRHTRFDCDWSSDVCSSDLSVAAGVLIGVAFVQRQRRLEHPLIELQLFRSRAFSAALVAYMLGTFAVFGAYVFKIGRASCRERV